MSLFPMIESANLCKTYAFGEYQAVLLHEVYAAYCFHDRPLALNPKYQNM